jgi:hypothetical protein
MVVFGNETFDLAAIYKAIKSTGRKLAPLLKALTVPTITVKQKESE